VIISHVHHGIVSASTDVSSRKILYAAVVAMFTIELIYAATPAGINARSAP
jgi:hypothetical protein